MEKIDRIRDYPRLRDGWIRLLALLAVGLFIGHELSVAFFVRVFTFLGVRHELAVNITSFVPFILSIPLLVKRFRRVRPFFIIYFSVMAFFAISILMHPEARNIYFRPRFGIHKVFFPSGGIFILYYILLMYDKDDKSDLINMLFIGGSLLFLISFLQYGMAQVRGYWLTEGPSGNEIKINYSLIFGFNMSLIACIFAGLWFYRKKIGYLLVSLISYFTILTDGNRMSLILIFSFLFLLLIHNIVNKIRYKESFKPIIRNLIGIFSFVLVFVIAFTLNKKQINPAKLIVSKIDVETRKKFGYEEEKVKSKKTSEKTKSKNEKILAETVKMRENIEKYGKLDYYDGSPINKDDGKIDRSIREEDGKLYFYENGERDYKGLIVYEGNFIYVKPDGELAKSGQFDIEKTNNILNKGSYFFDDKGSLRIDLLEKKLEAKNNDSLSAIEGKSRTLELINNGGLLFNNARGNIYSIVIDGIKDSPVIGHGAFADRVLTSQRYIWGHSHNIFLEILVNFGLVFGIPVLLYLLNTLIVMFRKRRNILTIMYFAFLGAGTSLLTSNSFWLEPFIWAMIGFSMLSMDREDYWINGIYNKIKGKKA